MCWYSWSAWSCCAIMLRAREAPGPLAAAAASPRCCLMARPLKAWGFRNSSVELVKI